MSDSSPFYHSQTNLIARRGRISSHLFSNSLSQDETPIRLFQYNLISIGTRKFQQGNIARWLCNWPGLLSIFLSQDGVRFPQQSDNKTFYPPPTKPLLLFARRHTDCELLLSTSFSQDGVRFDALCDDIRITTSKPAIRKTESEFGLCIII